jgi:hypothetical protein
MPEETGPGGPEDIAGALQTYFGSAAGDAEAIISRESGWDSNALNNTSDPNAPASYHPPAAGDLPEYSIGLFQINTLAWPDVAKMFDLWDPVQNIQAAAYIYQHNGWGPWGGSPNAPGSTGGGGGGTGAGGSTGGGGSSGAGGGAGAGASAGGGTSLANEPDWVIGGISIPGTGSISTFFARLSDLLAYFEVNVAQAIIRLFLVLIGLALVLIGLMFFMQSLAG